MSLKGLLGKELLPAGDLTHPKASVMGVLMLAMTVIVVLAALKIGNFGFAKGKAVVGGLVPSAKEGAADMMAQLEAM
jgi:hypothetical protein